MKIVKPTLYRLILLILQGNNLITAVGTVLTASIFVLFGLMVMVLSGERATLTCQRVEPTQGSCQLVISGLFGSDEITIPLNQLQNAKLELITDTRGRGGYRVVLLTDYDKVPFISTWSHNEQEKQKKADLINAFIGNPGETSLRIQQDERWSAYSVGGFIILVGGWATLRKGMV